MNPKFNTYSYDQYVGYSDNRIKSLKKDLSEALLLAQVIENEIIKIQNDCIHTYMFSANGAYEDSYVCSKCGHETWK